jgi:hypothetical protein
VAGTHLEVERKYDPAPETRLPDLSGLPKVAPVAGLGRMWIAQAPKLERILG